MDNFDWTQFTRKIDINASLSTIYDAWTKASEIERWFLKEALFFDEDGHEIPKDQSAVAGQDYYWVWYVYEETERGRIIEANGRDFFTFTFSNSIVEVHLSERDGRVIVELTQKNIPTDADSMKYIRLGCHAGWGFYLVNLKSIYEGGIDLRNMDSTLTGMLNV